MWISAGGLLLILALAGWAILARNNRKRSPSNAGSHAGMPASPGIGRWLARVGAVSCLALAGFFYYAWYVFYLKWDFNELGRYYDPVDQVVYTSSGGVWVLPATGLLAAGVFLLWRGWRR